MKIGYLILAHKNPELIARTVEVLSCDGASFFIHIDAKVRLEPFEAIRRRNVMFVDRRIRVYWGEISQTDAIFLLMRTALAAPQRFDYFVLLSGSDFPLRSGLYVRDFLERHRGQEFISMFKLPTARMPLERINTIRFPSMRPAMRFAFRALARAGLAQRDYRKHLGGLEPYSGHTWWALTRAACLYISDFEQGHENLREFFKNTHASDEMLIHTILGNSRFKSEIRRHLVYEDWPEEGARHHPKEISAKHVEYFESENVITPQDAHGAGEMLFARKFSDEDLRLVDRIIDMIRKKETF